MSTCLKSAPDNLIFHLKRFDFDLTDFSRKKVHEYFSFPDAIDIGLYNVDHLSDPTTPHTEDLFDLVGVVVHFGSCENGHYYSYIRKRPCPTGDASPTWLNFNDQEVDPFDPAEIPQKAFGGVTDDGFTRNYKMYSAYMLFYQRRTAIVKDQERWSISTRVEPPNVEVPRLIQDDIDVKNDLFIRKYCLFDPSHAAFVRQLHEKNVVLYGTSGIESSSDMALDTSSVDLGVIAPIAKRLFAITAESYRNPKGWDDLYLTLTQIFAMGHVEKATLLDAGLLEFCLALFCMHARSRIADEYSAFNRVFKRQGYHNRLVGFVTTMLAHIDVNLPICDGSDRLAELEQEQTSFPLTAEEKGLLLYWHAESKAFAVVDKMLEMFDQTKTELFYPGEVVKSMAASLDDQVQRKILTMIVQGITELNPPHCDAYLRVASSYCETIRAVNPLNRVCDAVVEAFVTSEQAPAENYGPDGRNVLRFFQDLLRLGHAQTPATDICGCLINRSDKYASALLLTSEEAVRDGTRQFIRDVYSKYMEDPRHLGNAYACIRLTATDIIKRATYEPRSGMPRRHLAPLLETGTFLLSLLLDLDTSEDPDLVDLKDENDKALIFEWRAEVEPSVRHLPEINMPSPGEGIFDASDYGSESDDVELLDP
ncbi:hypothetical protein SLS59_004509 [Nothophoma quercina]|uniref:USP domain-containing protein n=1 Tax=Nothophoma quercina TaxID=749835 RepID=A0ABR3RGC2_9PLEO